jgi:hypothetical protein
MSTVLQHFDQQRLQKMRTTRLYQLARAHGVLTPPRASLKRNHLTRLIIQAQRKARPRLCAWPGCKIDINRSSVLALFCTDHKLEALRATNRQSSRRRYARCNGRLPTKRPGEGRDCRKVTR